MEFRIGVSKERVLELLNVVPPDPSTYYRFVEKFLDERSGPEAFAMLKQTEQLARQNVQSRQVGFVTNYLANECKPSPPPQSVKGWQLPDTISRTEFYSFRDALTSAALRIYVDQWINTGRSPDGSESPKERKLNIYSAVHKFVHQAPLRASSF
jgi:hypothetical protein